MKIAPRVAGLVFYLLAFEPSRQTSSEITSNEEEVSGSREILVDGYLALSSEFSFDIDLKVTKQTWVSKRYCNLSSAHSTSEGTCWQNGEFTPQG